MHGKSSEKRDQTKKKKDRKTKTETSYYILSSTKTLMTIFKGKVVVLPDTGRRALTHSHNDNSEGPSDVYLHVSETIPCLKTSLDSDKVH